MIRTISKATILCLLFTIIALSSCKQYYKEVKVYDAARFNQKKRNPVVTKVLLASKKGYRDKKRKFSAEFPDKYIVIHQGTAAWQFKNTIINKKAFLLTGTFYPIDSATYKKYEEFTQRLANAPYYSTRAEKPYALGQMHIYLNDSAVMNSAADQVRFADISSIVDYRYDQGRNSVTKVLPIVFGVVGTGVVTAVGAILAVCNCPYVYTSNGSLFNFTGTMYTGAVYKNLERPDYMPIATGAGGRKEYEFRIANKRNERQFINLVDLTIVHHAPGLSVIPDKEGVFHTISILNAPLSATCDEGINRLEEISQKDSIFFSFDAEQEKEPLNSLVLKFKKQEGAAKAKLVLNAKNTEWFGYTYDQICKLMGDKYAGWVSKQTDRSGRELSEGSLKQGVPLSVYLKTPGGWKFIDYFNAVGSLTARDIVMPFDLSEIPSDTVEVMLKSGFMFWEIDRAAIDFSVDEIVRTETLKPLSAKDQAGKDHLAELLSDDELYMEHDKIDDEITLEFKCDSVAGDESSSVFLHGKGYYNRLDKYEGKPDYLELNKIRKPGGFSRFSRQKFLEFKKSVVLNYSTGDNEPD